MTGGFQNGKEMTTKICQEHKKKKCNKTVSEKRNMEQMFMVSYHTKLNELNRRCAQWKKKEKIALVSRTHYIVSLKQNIVDANST